MRPCVADAQPWVPGLLRSLVWTAPTPDFRPSDPSTRSAAGGEVAQEAGVGHV